MAIPSTWIKPINGRVQFTDEKMARKIITESTPVTFNTGNLKALANRCGIICDLFTKEHLTTDYSYNRACSILQYALSDFAYKAQCIANRIPSDVSRITDYRSLVKEIAAIRKDFGGIEYNYELNTMIVLSKDITIQTINFGVYEIHIDTNLRIDSIRIYPLTPKLSYNGYFHPHVNQRNILCLGNGEVAIRKALKECRIYDAFMLIDIILGNYGRDPYCPMEAWIIPRVTCHECSIPEYEERTKYCTKCKHACCRDCYVRCPDCDTGLCRPCRTMYCEQCRRALNRCTECRNKKGECCVQCTELREIAASNQSASMGQTMLHEGQGSN